MLSQDEKTTIALVGGVLILVVVMLLGAGGFVFFFLYRAESELESLAVPSSVVVNETAVSIDPAGDVDLNLVSPVTVVLKSAPDGSLQEIVVQNREVQVNLPDLESLTKHLRQLGMEHPNAVPLNLKVDSRLRMKGLEEAQSTCEHAGFPRPEKVSLLNEEDDKP